MKLVSKKTGEIVDVPDAQAQAAFMSGQYGVPKGAPMPVKAPGLAAGVVDPADAAAALEGGARVATEGEFHQAQQESRYGGVGGAAAAAGVGAARGFAGAFGVPLDTVALGLVGASSAPGEREIDPYRGERMVSPVEALRERLRGYNEQHPLASGFGELGGMAGAALVGGGVLGKVGAAGEALGGTVGRFAGEGAFLGLPGALNEAALGDERVTAGKVLAAVGHGAIIGGALGEGFHLGAEATAGMRDRLGRWIGSVRPKDIEAVAAKHFGYAPDGLGERVQKGYARASASMSGKDASLIDKFTELSPEGAEARRIGVFDAPKVQEDAERAVRRDIDGLMSSGDLVSAEARGGLKAEYVRRAIKSGNEAETAAFVRQRLDAIEIGLEQQVAQEMAPSMKKSARTIQKLVDRTRALVNGTSEGVDALSAMRTTGAEVLDDIGPVASKVFGRTTSPHAWEALSRMPEGYSVRLDRFVEDAGKIELYGEARNASGKFVGEFGSTFHRENGRLVAKTDNLLMGEAFQKQGVGAAIARNLEETYRRLGADEVRLHASQVGRYVWAKAGYQWDATTGREMETSFRSWLAKHGHDVSESTAALRGARELAESTHGKEFLLSKDAPNWYGSKTLEAVQTGNAASNADAFIALDNLKRGMQRLTSTGYRGLRAIADPVDQLNAKRTIAWLDGAAQDLRVGLEDNAMWGKAADDQRAINAAWSRQIDASKRFHRALTTEVGRDPTNPYLEIRGADPAKVATYVKGLTNPHNDLTHAAVRDYVDSTEVLSKAIRDSYDLPAEKLSEVDRVAEAAKGFRGTIDEAEKSLVTANQYRALLEAPEGGTVSSALGMVGSLIGGMPGGVLGTIAGAAMNAAKNPGKVVAQMAAIERLAAKSDHEIAHGVRSFLSGGKPKVSPPASVEMLQSKVGTRATFEAKVKEVQRLTANKDELGARIREFTDQFGESAPNITTALTAAAIKGVEYLSATAPPGFTPRPEALAWGIEEPPLYTDAEMRVWSRRAAVVNNPFVAVQSMKRKMLTPEEAHALREVHTPIFNQLQSEFQKQRVENKTRMSYGQSLQIELMFGVPLTRTLEPGFMRTVQQSFSTPEPKVQKSDIGSKLSGSMRTVSQQIGGR